MASDLFADPPVAQKALVEALARLPAALHLPEPERSRAAERPSGAHHHQRRSIDRPNCIGQPSGTLGPKTVLDQPRARDAFSITAERTRAFNASSSIVSSSRKSMARLVLPSRLALKSPDGSSSAAPLAKVIFTTFL
jgi:hypothetical protein